MFENLIKFWRGSDFLTQVHNEFREMLVDGHEMFDLVCKKLIHGEQIPSLKEKIYNVDRKINKLEKDIRTRIVEHLSLRPTEDVSACLLLMSVVKDAERLGDYCKNLFEVIQLHGRPIDQKRYEKIFDHLDVKISSLFDLTKKAFIDSDEEKARDCWKFETEIAGRCDEIIEELAKSKGSVNEAVCFALIARYYKRLTAHMTNIATSVVLPISELDYFDEKHRTGKDKKDSSPE